MGSLFDFEEIAMRNGFVKVAAVTPDIKVANPEYNREKAVEAVTKAANKGAKLIVLPELVLSSYTCNDLFLQSTLLTACKRELIQLAKDAENLDAIIFAGVPLEVGGNLYNVAAAIYKGKILALIPKRFIPNYSEFYEARYFTPGPESVTYITLNGESVPFGTKILLECADMPKLCIGCEICEDLWVPDTPGTAAAMAGASILVNLSASDELVGKDEFRRMLVSATSARLIAGYIYTSAGAGESTQDIVFGGHNIIAENGSILSESTLFENGITYADIDVERIINERRRMTTFITSSDDSGYLRIPFEMNLVDTKLERAFYCMPFVPSDKTNRDKICEKILNIQAMGLKKRLEHTDCRSAVIGISGGLDSTLAVLVTVKAFDMLGIDRSCIETITMPCFGTTGRTYNNSCALMRALGTNLREIDIKEAVSIHFRDIGQSPDVHDVTYENCQARERTQILMDMAKKTGGMVIGTGDMSELALGWATYNGDHMSMYGVNAGVPKTLVRYLVGYYADICEDEKLKKVLLDILDTPVSPELIPPVDGKISQKTEEIVGNYELHDFFLYYMLRCGFTPDKVYRIALIAFDGKYEEETILKWLKNFYRRFFSQQFKRSCAPDSPKVGSVALSPRGDLRMPSDACVNEWMRILDSL